MGRKRTLCGTPNYIAPEVLGKKGHSYEVDVWRIGCILYTLLVGKPPFETQTLKDTYTRIKKNEYHIPSRIGPLARNLIQRLLQHEPARRPSVGEILKDDFIDFSRISVLSNCHGHHLMTSFECAQPRNILYTFYYILVVRLFAVCSWTNP